MNKLTSPPSTTITWAAISGFVVASGWGAVDTFTGFEPSAMLVGNTVALASGLVGKLVTEKRYKMIKRPIK